MLNLLPLVLARELKDLVFYYKINVSLALLTLMFLNIHRLFFTAVLDKLILTILKLLFVEPVLLSRITKYRNFVCSPKFPSSLSSTQPLKQFVFKTLLYRHECFTGKYTTRKIHKNYIRDPSGLFSIISHVSLSMT